MNARTMEGEARQGSGGEWRAVEAWGGDGNAMGTEMVSMGRWDGDSLADGWRGVACRLDRTLAPASGRVP